MKTKDGSRLDRATLKEKYLACLRARSPRSLRRSVKALIRAGVSRDLLFAWAVKAGNDKKYVGKLLSECFCDLGLRDRKKGGGRRPSPEGVLLFFFARDIFGDRHRKYLRAACRAAKNPASRLHAKALKLVPVPELYFAAIERLRERLRRLTLKRPNTNLEPYDDYHHRPLRFRATFCPSAQSQAERGCGNTAPVHMHS